MIALTRAVPPAIARCELTHLDRTTIDFARATVQHHDYERALEALGCRVRRLPETPHLPDSVFVEDAAIVLDEIAILTRPGAESRRPETVSVGAALGEYRRVAPIEPPGTMDGGDVLRIGMRIFVGLSVRTNEEAVRQLEAVTAPFGYRLEKVPVGGCLHLKSAVTQVAAAAVLLNPAWVDPAVFASFDRIDVHPDEPCGANALLLGGRALHASEYPRTRERLERYGISTMTVESSELAKAEGGLTCCSLIIR